MRVDGWVCKEERGTSLKTTPPLSTGHTLSSAARSRCLLLLFRLDILAFVV